MDQYECHDIDLDSFMTQEAPRTPTPDVPDGDGLSQQLNTLEDVSMVEGGPQNQCGDHGIGLNVSSAIMGDSLDTAGIFPVDNQWWDLTNNFLGDNQGWNLNEFREQSQATRNVEVLRCGEQGAPGYYTENAPRSSPFFLEGFGSVSMDLDPLPENQTSLSATGKNNTSPLHLNRREPEY